MTGWRQIATRLLGATDWCDTPSAVRAEPDVTSATVPMLAAAGHLQQRTRTAGRIEVLEVRDAVPKAARRCP